MSVAVWMVPVVLAALVVFLWAAAWLEGLVAPLGYEPEIRTIMSADTAFTDTAARPLGTDGQLGAELENRAA